MSIPEPYAYWTSEGTVNDQLTDEADDQLTDEADEWDRLVSDMNTTIGRLEAENTKLHGWLKDLATKSAHERKLEAELAEARKDTEIIEWLDKHKHKLDFQSGGGFVYAWEGRFRATVRELMRYDAAMKEDGR